MMDSSGHAMMIMMSCCVVFMKLSMGCYCGFMFVLDRKLSKDMANCGGGFFMASMELNGSGESVMGCGRSIMVCTMVIMKELNCCFVAMRYYNC